MPQYFGQLPVAETLWTTAKSIETYSKVKQGIDCKCSNGELLIVRVLAANLIRVRLAPKRELKTRRPWAVTVADEEWSPVEFKIQETASDLTIITAEMRVQIQREPVKIEYFDKDNRPFAGDTSDRMGWRDGEISIWKKIEQNEHIYGLGEPPGLLDRLGQKHTMWTTDALDYTSQTDPMYQAIPFYMAVRPEVSYGLLLNSTYWSQFDLGCTQPEVIQIQSKTTELDYYLIHGSTPAKILETYTQLTGRMPLPPKWALGYHQCRWSYESETVVKELAREFRQREIPCDVIHLDIDYMRGYRVFTWSPKRFPEPKQMLQELQEQGFNVVTIIDPGVKYEPEADYEIFDEGLAHDYFVRKPDGELFYGYVWPDKAVFPDFMRPEVQEWWGEWHQSLTEIGIAGIWNDMNEPSIANRPFGDGGEKIFFPLDTPQGSEEARTNHAETHNLYGLMMAEATYEGLKKVRPNRRSFLLTRSGYAGIQRYSAVWTGDNYSLWEYLEMSLPMLCNLGLSGVGFVGADIGGFAENATAELFARWIQVGMLYPLMRSHSAMSTNQQEPWHFGTETENICREYIQLRYRLLPYIYNLFWEAATTGAPILRPLVYQYPGDKHVSQLHDQVFLGANIMAAPVYRPGVECRTVYLPAGKWYDWWSGEEFEGGKHILADAPLTKMPLFARAGAIIPLQPVMQYVDRYPVEELTLRVYPGAGEFTLYEDDGDSFEYQQGAFCQTTYRVREESKEVIFEVEKRIGNWLPPKREVIVELVGIGEKRVTDDGQAKELKFSR
ncbi:MAG: glycoside hydrolase family 31 protein [Oscillatoria sp. PMC 1051.18]|nr:glycoside hydrolase family 31 protein [Oscillatoria sp. PMC 1050.18]MEC5031547.1 glycoside hydrolase family 31 protein [Oscillatoria sp. PMC 1051.18]